MTESGDEKGEIQSMLKEKKIGFIGGGNMGEALIAVLYCRVQRFLRILSVPIFVKNL